MLVEGVVLGLVAVIGAVTGTLITKRLSRAKPRAYVSSCELSRTILTRVDYLQLPANIAELRNSLKWVMLDEEDRDFESLSSLEFIPVGVGAEILVFLREFLHVAAETSGLLREVMRIIDGDEDEEALTAGLVNLIRSNLFSALFEGMVRRKELASLRHPSLAMSEALQGDGGTLLTRVLDEATGPQIGVMGSYSIHTGRSRRVYVFRYDDERESFAAATYILAGGDPGVLRSMLNEMVASIDGDRTIAGDLRSWFDENLDRESHLVVDVTVANLGREPFVVGRSSILRIAVPDSPQIEIDMFSESMSDPSSAASATDRLVKLAQRTRQQLGSHLSVSALAPRETVFVPPEEAVHVTFRSVGTLGSSKEGDSLSHLYHSRLVSASLELERSTDRGGFDYFNSEPFQFESSLRE